MSATSTARAPLTGLAIGDALGMPFETSYADAYALVQWKGGYATPAPPNHHKLKAGQFTDDTQMSVSLAEHLVEHGFYDPGSASKNYLAWFRSGDCRGIGTSTRKALERMAAGAAWSESGERGAEGNGSAMRAGMIGVFHHRGMQRLGAAADWARVDASITHQSEEAAEASVAMAVALSHLCSGGSREELLGVVLSQTRKTRVHFALEDLSRGIPTWKERGKFPILRDWIIASNLGPRGPGARASESVPAAFAAFLSASTFLEAVEGAVRAGGDTDSVAAMAGSMAGAFWGYHTLPQDLIDGLERHEEIRELELRLLGG